MEQDVVIRSAQPADMPAVSAAYEWLFVPPDQRPPQWGRGESRPGTARSLFFRPL